MCTPGEETRREEEEEEQGCPVCWEQVNPLIALRCGHAICKNCQMKWRRSCYSLGRPESCPICRHLNPVPDSKSDASSRAWIRKHTKPCPHCHVPVVKNGGCDAIVCVQCDTNFCWSCGRIITGHECKPCIWKRSAIITGVVFGITMSVILFLERKK